MCLQTLTWFPESEVHWIDELEKSVRIIKNTDKNKTLQPSHVSTVNTRGREFHDQGN